MNPEAAQPVRLVLEALYRAYFAGDTDGMLATMADDIEIRFLGRAAVTGIGEARSFFVANNASLQDLDFRIRRTIIDGEWAAVVWDETAMALGRPYSNHGVDVFRVVGDRIKILRVNIDVVRRRRAFDDTKEEPKA